jgi:two-component system, NtrC family, sensor kinase
MGIGALFRKLSLSAKLISSYLIILGVGGVAITVVGSTIVSRTIMAEAERTVRHDLAIARTVLGQEIQSIRLGLEIAAAGVAIPHFLAAGDTAAALDFMARVGGSAGLDFVSLADAGGRVQLRARPATMRGDDARAIHAVAEALDRARPVAGAEVLAPDVLGRENPLLPGRAAIPLTPTPWARPQERDRLTDAMVLIAAVPVHDGDGEIVGILYGGQLVNGEFTVVDRVWTEMYRDESPPGTVTIFLDDVRISTNVRGPDGQRAVGTQASADVAEAVLERGGNWNGRAFVVHDWYITAYQPIHDLAGEIIGMLYVGLPQTSYVATRNGVIASFVFIASVGFLLVMGVTYLGIQRMTRPLGQMVQATRDIAAGDFDREVRFDGGSEGEIARLAHSFNVMLASLRQMRGDLEEWGRTLEAKVSERTQELVDMQSRVAQAERLASIGMLAAGVAHEINNPLGGILALTALTLEDTPADDRNRENLEEVVRQTERCRDIVKHLLEFSRQSEVSTEESDLNEVLERTLALLRRQSLFFNVDIDWRLADDLPPVLADRSQLQQVFMNIVMNAVQAMDERGTITIGTRPVEPDAVEIWLADTGCGIPPEHIDRIFDPFFTTRDKGQGTGTGLGLSIAYGIVTKHHGTIRVESELSAGTTFTIRLPTAACLQEA